MNWETKNKIMKLVTIGCIWGMVIPFVFVALFQNPYMFVGLPISVGVWVTFLIIND